MNSKIKNLQAQSEQFKNHWETLRSIREISPQSTRQSKTFFGVSADKFSDEELTEIGECVAQELADRAIWEANQ